MQPNVLVVVVDGLRADRVGTLGGGDLTPNVDEFAAESAIFTNAFTTSNATDVAVTSIQTGRYPLSHGVVNHGRRVTDEEKRAVENVRQLPEILSDAGYRTAKFGRPLGRWHRRGFDSYPSFMESRAAFDIEKQPGQRFREALGGLADRVGPDARKLASRVYRRYLEPIPETVFGRSKPEEGDGQVDELLGQFSDYLEGSTPFFAFVHLMDTHAPYEASPELVRTYLDRYDYETTYPTSLRGKLPGSFEDLVRRGQFPDIAEKYYYPDGVPSSAVVDAHYDAAVTQADERIGRILARMDEEELLEETLVVVLSDHGESLTEHGIYYDHHGLYDVTTRVPLLVRPPGGADGTLGGLVQTTDVLPTIVDYAGLDDPGADGRSLRPAIDGGDSIDREFVLAEEAHTQRRRMIRTDRDKLIYLLEGDTICRYCEVQHAPAVEFYDCVEDPVELNNLAGVRVEDVESLRDRANRAASEFERRRPTGDGTGSVIYEDEEEVYDRLEALGYR